MQSAERSCFGSHITETYMGNQTPNKDGRSDQTAPGKPASRQPPDANTGKGQGKDKAENADREEGQEIPKTGRDQSKPIAPDD